VDVLTRNQDLNYTGTPMFFAVGQRPSVIHFIFCFQMLLTFNIWLVKPLFLFQLLLYVLFNKSKYSICKSNSVPQAPKIRASVTNVNVCHSSAQITNLYVGLLFFLLTYFTIEVYTCNLKNVNLFICTENKLPFLLLSTIHSLVFP
jgi:hypothetical protein